MPTLSDEQKRLLIALIEKGEPLPAQYRRALFDLDDAEYVERTGVYSLEYKGKAREQDILADTPAAPLQEIRSFNADNPHPAPHADWRNLLIYGDNLLALKALYEDQRGPNRFGTKDKIKLIYIDPPFATKQDFMKDREKAYRDKLIGAQFIEFLRKRLVLLREILADDGAIYVHLDWKKGHYIKAILDEVFGEENFVNEIVWCYSGGGISKTAFPRKHDTIFYYKKSVQPVFNPVYRAYSEGTQARGRTKVKGDIALRDEGTPVEDWWTDVPKITSPDDPQKLIANSYPTQKSEELLSRILSVSTSREDDVVLDCFGGSGTTAVVAEKLNRRWITIDCGRLAIHTIQKRMLHLTEKIGTNRQDQRLEYQRVNDLVDHAKGPSKASFLLFDKAKAGELEITDAFLADFANFLIAHCPTKKGATPEFSLLCPEDKLSLHKLKKIEDGDLKAGQFAIDTGGVRFLISFIEPKTKAAPAKPLKARHFALFNAGVYDRAAIRQLDWAAYKPFVMQLFGVRSDPHKIHAFQADGYIGTDAVHIWNYPDQKSLTLDEGYIESLHQTMRGHGGDRFYVIAPVSALDFMTDELVYGNTRYIVLKVPESVLNRLLSSRQPGALKQPMSESEVNEVIDAVGFDFVSQPLTEQQYLLLPPPDADLTNAHLREAVVRLTEFRAKTLSTAPEDFANFETLSMAMVDPDFNGDVFTLGSVHWADDLIMAETKRLNDAGIAGACEQLDIRIPAESLGQKAMVILVDRYGNEKRLEVPREAFIPSDGDGGLPPRPARSIAKKAARKVAKTPAEKAAKKAAKKAGRSSRG